MAEESTSMSFEAIMGIIIAILIAIFTLAFVTGYGAGNASFLPAYVRDVGNIMEGVVSTPADVSVVYDFWDEVNVSWRDGKLTIVQDDAVVPNKVFIPDDVSVIVTKTNFTSKHLLIHKTDKTLTLAMIQPTVHSAAGVDNHVRSITEKCGDDEYTLSFDTTVSDLNKLTKRYTTPDANIKLMVTIAPRPELQNRDNQLIVYYDESNDFDDFLCKIQTGFVSNLKITPVFIPTTHKEILGESNVIFTFSNVGFAESALVAILDKARGGARG